VPGTFCAAHAEYLALGDTPSRRGAAYRAFFQQQFAAPLIDDIRATVNQGLVLVTDRFKTEVEQLTGQSQQPLKRGATPR